jgi:hypothetical protein
MKRGQVTIFLVVGILILCISALIFFFASNITTQTLENELDSLSSTEFNPAGFVGFIESCIEDTAISSLFLVAKNGGFIYPEEDLPILITEFDMIQYGILEGISGFSVGTVEQDIGRFIEEFLYLCTADFEAFRQVGFSVHPEYQNIQVGATLTQRNLFIETIFPLVITTPTGDEVEIDHFSQTINTHVGKQFDILTQVATEIHETGDIASLEYEPYVLTLFPHDEKTMIISLTDNDNLLDNGLLTIFSAIDLPKKNFAPKFRYIADKTFVKGEWWQEVLFSDDTENDQLDFFSDSEQFPISSDGWINTTLPSEGTYYVTFSVRDTKGLEDFQEVKIRVIEHDVK